MWSKTSGGPGVFKTLGCALAKVLGELGAEHVIVVYGLSGMDEFSINNLSYYAEWNRGELIVQDLNPEYLGLELASEEHFIGGDAKHNAEIVLDILGGKKVVR